MTPDRKHRLLTWLLRLAGATICLSFFAIFLPNHWMQTIAGWLGIGDLPQSPIFEYLARTASGMYFAHGSVLLIVSTDVTRHRPVIQCLACLTILLGSIFVWVDWHAGMPPWWTALEGPPIAAFGIVLLWLSKN